MKMLDILATCKMYIGRSMGYFNLVNTSMILYLFLKSLELDLDLGRWMVPLVISWIIFLVVFGYLETRFLDMWGREQRLSHRQGYVIEMRKDIKDIKRMLE